jgi:hypothetical protein
MALIVYHNISAKVEATSLKGDCSERHRQDKIAEVILA